MMPDFLHNSDLRKVTQCLTHGGGQWRIVGGAVRNHLLGLAVSDVDIVCNLTDAEILDALAQENIKTLQIGRAFGVVQAVFPHQQFEIACLRRDVETDGRHAVIAPAKNFAEDSERRDFTINALYMDGDGNISDYHDGLADIKNRVLRFVGNPQQRIEEDYLRVLRLFRFQAELPDFTVDTASLQACLNDGQGLKNISGERIYQELYRWLLAPHALQALRAGRKIFDFLPEPLNVLGEQVMYLESLQNLLVEHPKITLAEPLKFLTILAVLYGRHRASDLARGLKTQLKLRNQDEKTLHYLFTTANFFIASDASQMLNERLDNDGADWVMAHLLVQQTLHNAIEPELFQQYLQKISTWQAQIFPLKAKDLLAEGVEKNEKLGIILKQTRQWWARDGFVANQAECLCYALKSYKMLIKNNKIKSEEDGHEA